MDTEDLREPAFSEFDWLVKSALGLAALVFLWIIVEGLGTLTWVLFRWGWSNG